MLAVSHGGLLALTDVADAMSRWTPASSDGAGLAGLRDLHDVYSSRSGGDVMSEHSKSADAQGAGTVFEPMATEEHRTLFELTDALLVVFTLDGYFRKLNPAWQRLMGFSQQDLQGRHYREFVHPDDRDATVQEGLALQRHSARVVELENRVRKADGTYLWLSWNITSDIEAGRTYAIAFDISERKQAEERLRQSVEMRRSITEASPDHILMLDRDGRILFSNRSGGDDLRQPLIGRSIFETADATFHDAMRSCFQAVLQDGEAGRYEIIESAADGSETVLEGRVGAIQRRGEVVALSVTLTDVTAARRAASDREQLIRELEVKNEELERYTYTVSHDLKSPLVTIKGFLGFLAKNAKAGHVERVDADIARISAAADHMSRLLDELLELSRIGRVVHPPEPVSLYELATEAAALVRQPLGGSAPHMAIDPQLPTVRGDRVRLFQVFQNLLENAAKFLGDPAVPRIRVEALPGDDGHLIRVCDNGIGIAPRYHERVFGLFNQLDPAKGGTGIGLTLVRRIVELHGGTIWLESDGPGHGTCFYFTLPDVEGDS